MQNRDAIFEFETRPTTSPYIEGIWRTSYEGHIQKFISIAETQWGMIITTENRQTTVTLRGPETYASSAPIPQHANFFGVMFKLGTFMPNLPIHSFVNNAINLPPANRNTFWLGGSAWELPTYENIETFVERLIKAECLIQDPLIQATLQGQPSSVSARSVQRRFLRATGISHGTLTQIQRAQQANTLLQTGMGILDVVAQLGYADQPHLTRSLRRFMGQTPAQLLRLPAPK